MISSIIRQVVNSYLAPYIDGLNADELQFHLLGAKSNASYSIPSNIGTRAEGKLDGEAVVSNLRVKKDALNKLAALPVDVKSGYLGKLKINFPTIRLRSQRIEVRLEKLFIVCGPKDESQWSESEQQAQEVQAKRAKLAKAEELRKAKPAPKANSDEDLVDAAGPQQQGLLGSFVSRIVENLHIFVEDVHIRYEDNETIPNTCFSAGLTFESLSLQSTDANWLPAFVTDVAHLVHKTLQLKNLAVYMNCNDKMIYNEKSGVLPTAGQLAEILLSQIHKENKAQTHSYLLPPTTAEVKLRMNKSARPEMDIPKITAFIDLETLKLIVNDLQYAQILALVDKISTSSLRRKFRSIRPTVTPHEKPRLWWEFIRNAMLGEINQKKRLFSASYIAKRRRLRLELIDLWISKLRQNTLQPGDQYRLGLIEDDPELTVEDIIYFRTLAEAKLRKETSRFDAQAVAPPAQPGLFGRTYNWLTGYKPQTNESNVPPDALPVTETIDSALASYIEYDELVQSAVDTSLLAHMPGHYVQVQLRLRIDSASVGIEKYQPNQSPLAVATLGLLGIAVEVKQKPKFDGVMIGAALHSIFLRDHVTATTAFRDIIKSDARHASMLLSVGNSAGSKTPGIWSPFPGHPWAAAQIEVQPVDNFGNRVNADVAVLLAMQPLAVVANVPFVMYIVNLFLSQTGIALDDLELEAVRQLDIFKRAAKSTLQKQIATKHTKLQIQMDVSAPKIRIPSDINDERSLSLMIDLGSITATSEKPKLRFDATEDVYDDIRFKLSALHVSLAFCGPTKSDIWQIVDPLDVALLVQLYNKTGISAYSGPNTANLAEVQLGVEIDTFRIGLSASKVNAALAVVGSILVRPSAQLRVPRSPLPFQTALKASAAPPPTQTPLSLSSSSLLPNPSSSFSDPATAIDEREIALTEREIRKLRVKFKLNDFFVDLEGPESFSQLIQFHLHAAYGHIVISQSVPIVIGLESLELTHHNLIFPLITSRTGVVADGDVGTVATEPADVDHLLRVEIVADQRKKYTNVTVMFNTLAIKLQPSVLVDVVDFYKAIDQRLIDSLAAPSHNAPAGHPLPAPSVTAPKQASASTLHVLVNIEEVAIELVLNHPPPLSTGPLVHQETPLTRASIHNVTAQLSQINKNLEVKGRLGKLLVQDTRQAASHPFILSTEVNDNFITFHFKLAKSAPRPARFGRAAAAAATAAPKSLAVATVPLEQIDLYIGVKLQTLAVIVIKDWIDDVIRYVHQLTDVIDQLPTAPLVANPPAQPSAASKAPPSPPTTVTFVTYEIIASRPKITVPKQATEPHILVANLGEIIAYNKFTLQDGFMAEMVTASITELNVKVTSVEDERGLAQPFVDDISVLVKVDRTFNDPKHTKPDLQVLAEISDIKITLSDEHILFLMATALDLTRPTPTRPAREIAPALPKPTPEPPSPVNLAPPTDLHLALAATVHLRQLAINLVQTTAKSKLGLAQALSLATVNLDRLALGVVVSSEGAMELQANIKSLSILDSRIHSRNVFRQILGPAVSSAPHAQAGQFGASATSSAASSKATSGISTPVSELSDSFREEQVALGKNLISVHFRQSPTAGAVVSAEVFQPRIIIPLDFVFSILGFVDKILLRSPPTNSKPAEPQPQPAPAPAASKPPIPVTQNDSMCIRADLKDFDVWVLQDSSSRSSLAFGLRLNALADHDTLHSATNLSIQEFQILKGQMHRMGQSLTVLDPFDAHVSVSPASTGPSALLIGVQLEPLHLKASYQDILLGIAIGNLVTESEYIKELDQRSAAAPSQEGLAPAPSPASVPDHPPVDAPQKPTITVRVFVPTVQAIVIDDVKGQTSPLLSAALSQITVELEQAASLDLSVKTELEVNYYNNDLGAWEPLLEFWPLQLVLSIAKHRGKDVISMLVNSDKHLNANVSAAFIVALARTLKAWQAEYIRQFATAGSLPVPVLASHVYSLRNRLGVDVTYWTDEKDLRESKSDTIVPLALSKQVLRNWSRSRAGVSDFLVGAKLSLRLPGFLPILDIPVVKPGLRLVALRSLILPHAVIVGYLVVDVNNAGGSITITLRSPVVFRNECSIKSIRLGTPTEPALSQRKILPGEEWPVPLLWTLKHTNPAEVTQSGQSPDDSAAALPPVHVPLQVDMVNVDLSTPSTFAPYSLDIDRKKHRLWCPAQVPPSASKSATPRRTGSTPQRPSVSPAPVTYRRTSSRAPHHAPTSPGLPPVADSKPAPPSEGPDAHFITAIRLHPTIRIENRLCVPMQFKVVDLQSGDPITEQDSPIGETTELFFEHIHTSSLLLTVKIDGYDWSTFAHITNPSALENQLCLRDKAGRELILHLEHSSRAVKVVTVYCKYWLVNRTGLPLLFKPVFEHKSTDPSTEPLAGGQSAIEALKEEDFFKDKKPTDKDSHILSVPLLYSPKQIDALNHYLSVKIGTSQWSEKINLDTVGWSGNVPVLSYSPQKQLTRSVQLGVRMILATPSKFFRTKVVVFLPQYILINNTDEVLYFKQRTGATQLESKRLNPDQHLPLYWLDDLSAKADHSGRLLNVSFEDTKWSGQFSVDKMGELALTLLRDHPKAHEIDLRQLLRVEIKVENATAFVIISKEHSEYPPYRIENETSYQISVCQRGKVKSTQIIEAHSKLPFAWDEPGAAHVLVVRFPKFQVTRSYPLDRIEVVSSITSQRKGYPLIQLAPNVNIQPLSVAHGPTRVLRLVEVGSPRISKPVPVSSNVVGDLAMNTPPLTSDDEPEVEEINQSTQPNRSIPPELAVTVALDGIGVSVIDSKAKELLYVTLSGILLKIENFTEALDFQASVHLVQIDNQAYDGTVLRKGKQNVARYSFPVVLSSPVHHNFPFLHIQFSKSHLYSGIDYFHHCLVALQELTLKIDRSLIEDIVDLVTEIIAATEETSGNLPAVLQSKGISIPTTRGGYEKKMYFEILQLHSIQTNITLVSNISTATGAEGPKREKRLVDRILEALNISLVNLDGVHLPFNALIVKDAFCTQSDLASILQQRYLRQAIANSWRLLGRFDFIGSPLTLIDNIGTGFVDFFLEPFHVLVSSPQDFVDAFAKGTESLLVKSTFGVSNSASKVTGALEKAITVLSKSAEEQQQQHAINYLNSAHSLPQVMWVGLKETGKSVASSVANVVALPVEGWRKRGATGFLYGFLHSIADIPLRPALAVVQTLHQSAESIRSTTAPPFRLRARPPRKPQGTEFRRVPLTPYNERFALGEFAFTHLILDGVFPEFNATKGEYEWHWTDTLEGNLRWWFVSSAALVHCVQKKTSALKLRWSIPWNCIEMVEKSTAKRIVVSTYSTPSSDTSTPRPKLSGPPLAQSYTISFADEAKCISTAQDLIDFWRGGVRL